MVIEEIIKKSVFKINVKAFPEPWNVYDSLGEAFMSIGNNELALINYKKSLELNPNSQTGINALRALKAKM